jgi:hypothetical protein
MKNTLIVLMGLLMAGISSGQTPAKSSQKAAGLGKASSESNQDLNIRAYIELLRTDVQKGKAQVMGEVMQLDADQATKFWPIYKSFATDLAAIGDRVAGLIRDYAAGYNNMNATLADSLGTRLLDLEQERNALKRKYYGQFKTALDPVTATRFLQVENQLEKLIDLQIAASLPVIE